MSQKTILVAGGGGFIGGHLVKEFLNKGHVVRCVDIKPSDEWYQVHDGAENVIADLQEKEACYAACEGMQEI